MGGGVTADDTSFFTASTTKGGDITTAFSSTKTRAEDAPDLTGGPKDANKDGKKKAKPAKRPTDPQPSKSRQTLKFKIRFDSHAMLFDDAYPPDLQPVLPVEEWEGLMRHLNTDLNQHIQRTASDLTAWTSGMLASGALVVGVFVVPVVWWKKHKHEHLMQAFWQDVRTFFSEINKKTFIRRGLEWKVVEERRKQNKRDCYNPVYLYRVELLWRQNVVKSKRDLARAGRTEQVGSSGVSGAMVAGAGVVAGGAAATAIATKAKRESKRQSKRKSASRPPSNIGSVKEVSPEREVAGDTDSAVGVAVAGTAAAVAVGAAAAAAVAMDEDQDNKTEASSESDMILPSRPVSGIVPREPETDGDIVDVGDVVDVDGEPVDGDLNGEPIEPVEPVEPSEPIEPIDEPIDAIESVEPEPIETSETIDEPIEPSEAIEPIESIVEPTEPEATEKKESTGLFLSDSD